MKDQLPVTVVPGTTHLGTKAGEGPAQLPCLSGRPRGQRHLTPYGDVTGCEKKQHSEHWHEGRRPGKLAQ